LFSDDANPLGCDPDPKAKILTPDLQKYVDP